MAITKGGGKGGEGFVGSLLLAVAGDKGIIAGGGGESRFSRPFDISWSERKKEVSLCTCCKVHVSVWETCCGGDHSCSFGHMIRVQKIEKRRTRFGIEKTTGLSSLQKVKLALSEAEMRRRGSCSLMSLSLSDSNILPFFAPPSPLQKLFLEQFPGSGGKTPLVTVVVLPLL